MNVFSYCLYGAAPKYCQGMIENLKAINAHYPDFHIYIYITMDVPIDYREKYMTYKNVKLIDVEHKGPLNMLYRFEPIDDPTIDLVFIRDADSRIHERDRSAIDDFVKSPKLFHIIRDHPYHGTPILGGMWGIKRGMIEKIQVSIKKLYEMYLQIKPYNSRIAGYDQHFLREMIYPIVIDDALIHDDFHFYEHENPMKIGGPPRRNSYFVGAVFTFDASGNEYNI